MTSVAATEKTNVLVTVEMPGIEPSIERAAIQLGVNVEDISVAFGLIPVDAGKGLFCVQVQADRLPADFVKRQPFQGPFADPEIAPMGPVQNSGDSKK